MLEDPGGVIARRREEYRLCELIIKQKAAEVYGKMTDNEKMGVRFGLFPAKAMELAELDLLQNEAADLRSTLDVRDVGRLLAVGIMDAANAGSKPLVV